MIGVRNEPGWFVTMFSLVSRNIRQGRHSVLESSNVGLNVHLSTREMKGFHPLYHPPHSLCSSRPLTLPYILRQNSSEGCPILTSEPSESSSLSFPRESLSSLWGPQLLQAFSVCEKRWCCWWWRTLLTAGLQNRPDPEGSPQWAWQS